MTGGDRGEGVAGRGVGRSPLDPALERAHAPAQVAASIQVHVQVQLTSCLLLGAVLKKA